MVTNIEDSTYVSDDPFFPSVTRKSEFQHVKVLYCVYIAGLSDTQLCERSLVTLQQEKHLTALSVNMFQWVCVCVRVMQ